ncbi:hypothetical protein [Rossellomorea marisflavi]|uniref:Uncharacterized protein n=1 Tax=Rossellomorea marisflavi TaxID=189381 RepID=A0A163LTJ2_9BACI|nr:hypothetical protein [Rossellomorea marisflavi]KZE50966.1 hypothetical protein AV649_16475 [Rossellomorea marisflavi]
MVENEPSITSTDKKRSKVGCIVWVVILVFVATLLFFGKFYYDIELKERTLLISSSPDHTNTIEIVEKGEPSFFGPSSIRIKYRNKYIDRILKNDGARPDDSNTNVEWDSNNTALITLAGREQKPETIEFNMERKKPFKNVQLELESNAIATSISPDNTNMIQITKTIRSQGEKPEEYLKIYYGPKGSKLKEYKIIDRIIRYSDQTIEWKSPTHATIDILRNDKILETIEIEIDL